MPRPSHHLRTLAEEFARLELQAGGPEEIRAAQIVRWLVPLGASRSRVYAWIAEVRDAAESIVKNRRPVRSGLSRVGVDNFAKAMVFTAVVDTLPKHPELRAITAPAYAEFFTQNEIRSVQRYLGETSETCDRVLRCCVNAEGSVVNPRVILQAVDAKLRCVEASIRLSKFSDTA